MYIEYHAGLAQLYKALKEAEKRNEIKAMELYSQLLQEECYLLLQDSKSQNKRGVLYIPCSFIQLL